MRKITGSLFTALILITVLSYSCKKGEIPVVTTADITGINQTSVTTGGTIVDDGGSEITSRGVCWNTSGNPTTANQRTIDGSGSGSFVSTPSQLMPKTYYTLRAYATNKAGTGYGEERSFLTGEIIISSVDDFEGNTYKTISMGTQTWMAENLKSTKYNDGTPIPLVSEFSAWKSLTTPGYCWYNNDSSNYAAEYGSLYNWYAVSSRKLCPAGWHVPSDAEWIQMTTYLGGEDIAGDKLKEAGADHWLIYNEKSTNETGFTALPAGGRVEGDYIALGYSCAFWTATSYDEANAWCRELSSGNSYVVFSYEDKNQGFSVRCVKNPE